MTLKVSFTVQDEYPEGFDRSRQVSGFRAMVSNIRDIGTNYNFNVGLNESDVISRMYFSEYADWITEKNYGILMREINNGWYRGIKLFPVLKGSFRIPTRIEDLKPDGDASKVRSVVLKHMEVD